MILDAHHDTLDDIIDYLEREVIFTRVGHAGVAQVNTRGIIAAAFDHWDSRGGDPNLHTHLAVANRVQTIDGTWLTIDSRGLHHAIVAVSELYDTMLADRLTRELGVDWEARDARPAHRRPRDRRHPRGTHRRVLRPHPRDRRPLRTACRRVRRRQRASAQPDRVAPPPPTGDPHPTARQARPGAPRRACRRVASRAETVTGRAAQGLVDDALDRSERRPQIAEHIADETIEAWATLTVAAVQARRSTWNRWNLITEAARLTHELRFASPADREAFTHRVVDAAQRRSIALHPEAGRPVATEFHRSSGEDVFTQHAGQRFTSHVILGAEQYLRERAATISAQHAVPLNASKLTHLGDDQRAAVAAVATSGCSVQVLIGPAGTGKTTTLAALKDQWVAAHGPESVLGLAPSASAAEVLAGSLGVECENTTKWLHESVGAGATGRADARDRVSAARSRTRSTHATARLDEAAAQIEASQSRWTMQPGQLVIVDEASLAGTLSLAALAHQAESAGATMLLVGDPAQLNAVDAGGALRMLADAPGVAELSSVWRFDAEWERDASIKLRDGDHRAIATYVDHDRFREGDHVDMLDAAYRAWLADTRAGRTSLLIAADNATVRSLNERARADLVAAGSVEAAGVQVSDGTTIGVGDRIVARRNNRALRDSGGWVRNGDAFTVAGCTIDGSLTVKRDHSDGAEDVVVLPSWYVAKHLQLAYATTAHRAQGATVDTAHTIVTASLSREVLYVAMTRGRAANHAYVALDMPDDDPDDARHTDRPASGTDVLAAVLARSDAERSASDTALSAHRAAESMSTLIPVYEHVAQELSNTRWVPVVAALAPPDVAERMCSSDAWPKLTALLRNATLAGLDAEQFLVDAHHQGDLEGVGDPTALLLGRVAAAFNAAGRRAQSIRLLAGIVVPGEPDFDPAAQAALDHAAAAINQRATHLVREATATHAPWLAALGPEPAVAEQARAWRTAVTAVATYRDRWDITDDQPLGDWSGADRTQRRDRARAQRAIDVIASQPSDPPAHRHEDEPSTGRILPTPSDRSIT